MFCPKNLVVGSIPLSVREPPDFGALIPVRGRKIGHTGQRVWMAVALTGELGVGKPWEWAHT